MKKCKIKLIDANALKAAIHREYHDILSGRLEASLFSLIDHQSFFDGVCPLHEIMEAAMGNEEE